MLARLVRTLRLHERHLSRYLLLLASDGSLSIVSHLDGDGGATAAPTTVRVRVVLQRQFDHRHSIGGRGVQKDLLLGGGGRDEEERINLGRKLEPFLSLFFSLSLIIT